MEIKDSNSLTNGEQIKFFCKRQKISLSSVAKELEISIQNFSNKLSKNNFDEAELRKIAKHINCEYHSYFTLTNDGKSK